VNPPAHAAVSRAVGDAPAAPGTRAPQRHTGTALAAPAAPAALPLVAAKPPQATPDVSFQTDLPKFPSFAADTSRAKQRATVTRTTLTTELLSVSQAAAVLGVSPATVRRASDAGVLPCRRSPGGHRRFLRSDLDGLSRDHLLSAGRANQALDHDALEALAALGEAVNQWTDLQQLLLAIAGHLLSVTAAVSCDIFRVELKDMFRCLVSLDWDGLDEQATGSVLRLNLYPVATEAIRDRDVKVVKDLSDCRLSATDLEVFREYGFESETILPLVVKGRAVGLIDLYSDQPGAFAASLDYMRAAAHIVAGAFDKAVLMEALEAREAVLRELLDLAGLLSQARDVEELLRTASDRLLRAVDGDHCNVYRRDGEQYRCVVCVDRDGSTAGFEGTALDLTALPEGAVARALSCRKPVLISDVETVHVSGPEAAEFTERGWRSEIVIPLLAGDTVLGLVDVHDSRSRDWREVADFVEGVGQLVAGALERAELLDRLERGNRELRTLADNSLEFGSTLDMDRVLISIARRMRGAVGAIECDIYSVDGDVLLALLAVNDKDELDAAWQGTALPLAAFPLSSLALRSRQPVVVKDLMTDLRASERERQTWSAYGLRSGVLIPLIHGARVVGLAAVFGRQPGTFGGLDLLRGLGQVAGQAIANARLYESLDRSAQRAALLNTLSVELSGTLDVDSLLKTVVERLRDAIGASECAAFRRTDGDVLECVAASAVAGLAEPLDPGQSHELADVPVSRLAMVSRRAIAAAGAGDPRLSERGRAALRRRGVRGFLVAPLVVQGAVFGAVELSDMARERVFSRDEIDLVEAVCRVAGLAMDNAVLFDDLERRNREAELLNEIAARTSASLDMIQIADAAVAGLMPLVAVSGYGLSLLQGDEWRVAYASEPEWMRMQLPEAGAPAGGMFAQLEHDAVLIMSGAGDGVAIGGHPGRDFVGSKAAIGLFDRERLVGALMLGSETPGAFESVGRALLERVGVHLSLAAHNARLYQEIKTLHLGNLKGLSTALNAKDYYTLGHAARVAAYMVLLGRELGWDAGQIEQVREAAYLHDIGKIGVSDRVLLKQGKLNTEEWELMRQHPAVSADIIGPLFPEELVAAVRHHHERWDGMGYPEGLAGHDIPEIARAMCVVDSYDAMSLHRPYRGARTYDDCVAELKRCRGEQFDPAMTDAFLRVLDDLARLRGTSRRAAEAAAARIDPSEHKALLADVSVERPEYAHIHQVLREVRDAHPQVRFMTTEAYVDGRCVVVVDGEDCGTDSFSPPGEDVMVDDAARQVLAGQPIVSNVLFVDDHGVWANAIVPVIDGDGEIVAAVVADAPALGWDGGEGFAVRGVETPVSTLQRAAVRLSRAEIDAITDGLTGLYNHRHLHERLAEEIGEPGRGGRTLSLLFCDLDFFKDYNDRHGHAAGDEALRATARIIEQCTRRDDVAARYGGEEFVVLLPGVDEARALEIAGRIRTAVAERHLASGGLTISIGVAAFPEAAQSKEALLEAADRAMYIAKRLGRDRVVAAEVLDR